MKQTSFTSLIVTYNSANEILHLLADIHSHLPTSKIVVIDNASQDDTVHVIQKNFPKVQLVRNPANIGYARAVNQGFDLCETEYVLLLNPDIRITSPRFIPEMARHMKHSPRIAAVAPLQFKNDGIKRRLNLTWSFTTMDAFRFYLSHLIQRDQPFTHPIRVTFLNAGCLFVRRSAFERVGRLNRKYFMYGEEPDLFLKFKRYGFKCYLIPNVDVTHYRERSLGTVPPTRRLWIKVQAARNIMDALITCWSSIMLDKFAINKAQLVKRD